MTWVATGIVGASVVSGAFGMKGSKDAAKAQKKQNRENMQFIRDQGQKARQDVLPLFDAAQQNRNLGQQAAFDVFGSAIPEQGRMLNLGNYQAQSTLLAGLPQQNNAILGMPIDYSQLQAQQLNPDYSWAQQQVPNYVGGGIPMDGTKFRTAPMPDSSNYSQTLPSFSNISPAQQPVQQQPAEQPLNYALLLQGMR